MAGKIDQHPVAGLALWQQSGHRIDDIFLACLRVEQGPDIIKTPGMQCLGKRFDIGARPKQIGRHSGPLIMRVFLIFLHPDQQSNRLGVYQWHRYP